MDVEELSDAIGANVRRLRAERGLSLDGLAAASDLSKGTVVAIEQQRSNPSVATLCALAEAFNVGLMSLLESSVGPMVKHRTPAEAIELWATDAGSSAKLLLGTDPPHAVEVWTWVVAPGDAFEGSAHPRGTIETLLVEQGEVEVVVGDRRVEVGPGDTVAFEGHEPHRYASLGDQPARFAMWITVGDPGAAPPMSSFGAAEASPEGD